MPSCAEPLIIVINKIATNYQISNIVADKP